MDKRIPLLFVGFGMAVAAVTWHLARSDDDRDRRGSVEAPREPVGETHAPRTREGTPVVYESARAAIREEVRGVLREELTTLRKQEGELAPSAAADAPEVPAVPTPSFATATEYVASRVREGRWSAEDRDKLGGELGGMTEEERTAVMRQVIVAVNSGTLRLEDPTRLF